MIYRRPGILETLGRLVFLGAFKYVLSRVLRSIDSTWFWNKKEHQEGEEGYEEESDELFFMCSKCNTLHQHEHVNVLKPCPHCSAVHSYDVYGQDDEKQSSKKEKSFDTMWHQAFA